MAVNIQIYGNTTGVTNQILVDFVGDVLVSNDDPFSTGVEYYFKITSTSRDTDGNILPTKVIRGLDELALNGVKQSSNDTSNAYSDVNSMIVDYTYDYVNGHDVNKHESGVAEQKPMRF